MPRKPPRPVGDFFGPFFSLEFIAPSPALAIGSGAEPSKAVADNAFVTAKLTSIDLANYAARLTVETVSGSPLAFTITLNPTYEAALDILDNRLVRIGTVVKVKWGYVSNGDNADIANDNVFVINEPPKVSFGRDIVMTIKGYDPLSSALMGKERQVIYSREQYARDIDLITYTLKDLKLTPDFSSLGAEELANINKTKDPTTEPADKQRDLWQFLTTVCENNNITFLIQESTVYFYGLSQLALTPEAYRLLWYMAPQNDRDIPMISFSAEALPSFFATPSKSLLSLTCDPDTGQLIRDDLDPASLRGLIRSDPTAQVPSKNNSTSGVSVPIDASSVIVPSPRFVNDQDFGAILSQPGFLDNASGKAKRLYLEYVFAANNMATVVAPGHPDVIPPMNMFVEGVGKAFSGTYQLRKAKHEVSTSGYEMTLELMRLASPPDIANGEVAANPTPPTSSGPTGSLPAARRVS